MSQAPKILVFGTGGIGSTHAALLAKSGASIIAICRSNYTAVSTNGILVRSATWGHLHCHPTVVHDVSEAAEHGPFDYVLVASKAFPGTAKLIQEAVTPGVTAIVLAQNGIGIEDEYAELYPTNTIISGVLYLPSTQVKPGIVEHGDLENFEIGLYPAPKAPSEGAAQLQRLSDLYTSAGAHAPIFADIQPRRWIKLVMNVWANPICALTLCDDVNFLRSSSYAADLARDVMREIAKVASAAGYPDAIGEQAIELHMRHHFDRFEVGGKEPSMLVDIHHKRPIEVEAILGNVWRRATKLGVETPYLRMLYVLAKARNFEIVRGEEWMPIAAYD